jgi:hypothetical protein
MSRIEIDKEFELLQKQQFSNVSIEKLTTQEIIRKSKVEYSEKLEPPPICLEIVTNDSSSIIGTMGTFSVIIGKAKSRKTFLTSLLISATLKNENANEFIRGYLPNERKKVIFFDTEQARYKVQEIQNRILKLAQRLPTDDLSIHCLRPYSKEQRINVINEIIYNTEGLGLIVIDGIRDLTFDINNPQEAVETTGLLMKWTHDLNIHCICVIHQNKGDNNARGHLGTELINKGDTIISVTKQTDNRELSVVEPEYCREKEFQPFAFEIDENGLPYIVEDWKQQTKEGKKKTRSPHDFELDTHRRVVIVIFELQQRFKYTELVLRIKTIWSKNGVEFGDNKAKEFLSYYQNEKLIIKKEQHYERYN